MSSSTPTVAIHVFSIFVLQSICYFGSAFPYLYAFFAHAMSVWLVLVNCSGSIHLEYCQEGCIENLDPLEAHSKYFAGRGQSY